MSVENPGNPRKLVKKKILLHCVSFDKLYFNLSVFVVLEKDDNNSQLRERTSKQSNHFLQRYSYD